MKKIFYFIFATTLIVLGASKASAHVGYLLSESEIKQSSGLDFKFLLNALKDPENIFMMIATVIILLAIYFIAIKVPFFKSRLAAMNERADGYTVFAPWMMRLSLGIALIGSGVSETLISPILQGYGYLSFFQIFLGFLILSGFLVIPSTIIVIGFYIFALTQNFYMFGNLDFFAMALSLLILDNEKPGLDHLIGLPKISPLRFLKRYTPLILRIGIGGAMMYLAVYEKLLNPHISEIIVKDFNLINVVPVSPEMWVLSAGIIEFVIGLSLILGFYTRISSAIAFIVLSLSFFYFEEDVSSHITLFGTLAVLFITRGGVWSFDCKRNRVNYEFICEENPKTAEEK